MTETNIARIATADRIATALTANGYTGKTYAPLRADGEPNTVRVYVDHYGPCGYLFIAADGRVDWDGIKAHTYEYANATCKALGLATYRGAGR